MVIVFISIETNLGLLPVVSQLVVMVELESTEKGSQLSNCPLSLHHCLQTHIRGFEPHTYPGAFGTCV